MAMLNAGALDKRVTIQERIETPDDGGGQVVTWENAGQIWASIAPGTGREFVQAQQATPELTHMVRIRYRLGLSPKHRLSYFVGTTERLFAIHAISDPLERHEQLVLYCSEEKRA